VTATPPAPEPVEGWVAAELRREYPLLRLVTLTFPGRSGRTPAWLKQRLRMLSDRFGGAQAVTLRQRPVPWAYRVFYRHIGLDPDTERTPMEAAAVERLLRGGFRSRNLLDDAVTVALVETGVPVWALDAEALEGTLGLRLSGPGDRLGTGPGSRAVPNGRIVVADERSPVATVFGDVAPGHAVTEGTTRMTLFALQVAGVPTIAVEEALDSCAEMLGAG
jgi:DNA/RNA-binding domain of Phe-tRNA-synthetase-like protein